MAINVLHQELSALSTAKKSASHGIENMTQALVNINDQLFAINSTLSSHKSPECPPDPRCISIITVVFHLYIVIAGYQGKSTAQCKKAIREFCASDMFQNACTELESSSELHKQLNDCCQLGSRLSSVNTNFVNKTINDILAFIINVIIWCQNSHQK